VKAVYIPVTLKIRTGGDTQNRNARTIARIAEDCGIQALAVHGRTRACRFNGHAEYDTIAGVVQSVDIPVFANGDIRSAEDAKAVLDHTGAAAVMIGRAAQGNPWLFREIDHYLEYGSLPEPVSEQEFVTRVVGHIRAIHTHYGEYSGIRIARKHVGWYVGRLPDGDTFRRSFNQLDNQNEQIDHLHAYLTGQNNWDQAA
jgi:tRNA-dihydrouridine synthase B